MKQIILFALFALLINLSNAQEAIQFEEKAWEEIENCKDCATCEGTETKTNVKKERKTFSFYCEEELIGNWHLIWVEHPNCKKTFCITGNDIGVNIGGSQFEQDDVAMADIFREVQSQCKAATKIERKPSDHSEYAFMTIRDFFSPFPLTETAPKAKAEVKSITPEDNPKAIYKVVEMMPRFPGDGCEELPTKQEKDQCSQKALLDFIYSNMNYPQRARDNYIEGTVVVQFIVRKDGAVTDAKCVRSIGGGCDEEAVRLVQLMADEELYWIPGLQRGKPVNVQFNFPVKFKLP